MPLIINKLPPKPERIVTLGHADSYDPTKYYYPPGATEPVLKDPQTQPAPPAIVEPEPQLEPVAPVEPESRPVMTEPPLRPDVQVEPEQEAPKAKRAGRKPADK